MPHRDGSNTLNSSQTELFATIVNGFLPLLQTSTLLGSNGVCLCLSSKNTNQASFITFNAGSFLYVDLTLML